MVKVEDLGVDDGKIALQGEVIYTEDRTLKSGKTLFSFDLYDGTSTITCKAFLNKETEKYYFAVDSFNESGITKGSINEF